VPSMVDHYSFAIFLNYFCPYVIIMGLAILFYILEQIKFGILDTITPFMLSVQKKIYFLYFSLSLFFYLVLCPCNHASLNVFQPILRLHFLFTFFLCATKPCGWITCRCNLSLVRAHLHFTLHCKKHIQLYIYFFYFPRGPP
jgi:hypothetical protein